MSYRCDQCRCILGEEHFRIEEFLAPEEAPRHAQPCHFCIADNKIAEAE